MEYAMQLQLCARVKASTREWLVRSNHALMTAAHMGRALTEYVSASTDSGDLTVARECVLPTAAATATAAIMEYVNARPDTRFQIVSTARVLAAAQTMACASMARARVIKAGRAKPVTSWRAFQNVGKARALTECVSA